MNYVERQAAIKGIIEVLEKALVENPNLKIYCNPKTWESLVDGADTPKNVCLSGIVPEGKMYSGIVEDTIIPYKFYPYTFDPTTSAHEPDTLPKILS